MSNTVLRKWYLVIRRGGVITQRIPVSITPLRESVEVDPYVGPVYRDFDTIIAGDDPDLGQESPSILAEYELVAVTQPWEISYLE
jgi:hypothetical protein